MTSPALGLSYHRASTIDQRPEIARDELRRAALVRDVQLVAEIEETGSGRRWDRPGLDRVFELVKRQPIRFVFVWKLSRFGRSAKELHELIGLLRAQHVTFVCTSQHLEIGPRPTSMQKLTFGLLADIAEFEVENIREQTKLGMAAARARGAKIGRPRLWFDPDQAERRPGESWAAVARRLKVSTDTLERWRARKKGVTNGAAPPGRDATLRAPE